MSAPLTPEDFAHQPSAVAGPAKDLLDADALIGQALDRIVGILTRQISFVLQGLCRREKGRIDAGGTDRGAYLPHGFPDCVEKCSTCVLHQVDTSGNRRFLL